MFHVKKKKMSSARGWNNTSVYYTDGDILHRFVGFFNDYRPPIPRYVEDPE